jgi:hypothetical protein
MDTTVTLDRKHFRSAEEKARQLGKTPRQYIHSLIDAASMSFDDILHPVRQGFRESGMTEAELDKVVKDARKAVNAKPRRNGRK